MRADRSYIGFRRHPVRSGAIEGLAHSALEQADHGDKSAVREMRQGKRKGKRIQLSKDESEGREQSNLMDADSRLMRRNKRSD